MIVTVPDAYTGVMLMGDLNKRRSRVMGMNPSEIAGYTDIEVECTGF